MVLSNPGTQHMSLSAGIAQEPVSMTPRLMAETFCFAPAQTLASPSRVRWSSAVDSTIELAGTGVAHKARAALSGLSVEAAAWPLVPRVFAHPRAADARVRPIFCAICNVNVRYIHATSRTQCSTTRPTPGYTYTRQLLYD